MALDYNPISSPRRYKCGHCGSEIVSTKGGQSKHSSNLKIYSCIDCDKPTFFDGKGTQVPGVLPGTKVQGLPDNVEFLYDEVRHCFMISAWTATTMLARKLLMQVAVDKGAPKDKSFLEYIDWIQDSDWNTLGLRKGLDRIRKKGNKANHEVSIIPQEEAAEIFAVLEVFLRLVYEYPAAFEEPPT